MTRHPRPAHTPPRDIPMTPGWLRTALATITWLLAPPPGPAAARVAVPAAGPVPSNTAARPHRWTRPAPLARARAPPASGHHLAVTRRNRPTPACHCKPDRNGGSTGTPHRRHPNDTLRVTAPPFPMSPQATEGEPDHDHCTSAAATERPGRTASRTVSTRCCPKCGDSPSQQGPRARRRRGHGCLQGRLATASPTTSARPQPTRQTRRRTNERRPRTRRDRRCLPTTTRRLLFTPTGPRGIT